MFAIWDGYPVSPGHVLIITRRHRADYFELDDGEREELHTMIAQARQHMEASGHRPQGYNIGMNCGRAAGQSVMHFHCHVIPRYEGDMDEPKGGVRHCIPGKGVY